MSKWKLECTNGTHRAHIIIEKGVRWSWKCDETAAADVWGENTKGRASAPDQNGYMILGPGNDFLDNFLDVEVGSKGKGTRNGLFGSFPANGAGFDWLCTEKE